MYRIIKIGMDAHSKNYTLCAMDPVIGDEHLIFANIQVTADSCTLPTPSGVCYTFSQAVSSLSKGAASFQP